MYHRTSSTIAANPLAGTVGQDHWVSLNHVGDGKRFRRLEVSRSIGGQVSEDQACQWCLADFLKSSDEVCRCASENVAQGSFRGALPAAIVAAFDRIDSLFNRSCSNEMPFHA